VCGMLCEVWPGMLQSARDGDAGVRWAAPLFGASACVREARCSRLFSRIARVSQV